MEKLNRLFFIVVLWFVVLPSITLAHETLEEDKKIFNAATNIYKDQDSYAAIEYMHSQKDPVHITKIFGDLMDYFYWQEQDLASALIFGKAGVNYGLWMADRAEQNDPGLAKDIRVLVRGMLYNIASDTWPGWDEAGIIIGKNEIKWGIDTAKANLRLSYDLGVDDISLSRSYWILAAHLFALEDYNAAILNYTEAARLARKAKVESEALLSEIYICLAKIKSGEKERPQRDEMERLLAKIKKDKDGDFFADQIKTFMRVYQLEK